MQQILLSTFKIGNFVEKSNENIEKNELELYTSIYLLQLAHCTYLIFFILHYMDALCGYCI